MIFGIWLSVVGMSAELIEEECAGRPEVMEETDQIQKAVRQGNDIVGSMLGYSKARLPEGETDGGGEVESVVEDLMILLGKQFLSGIELELDAEPGGATMAVPKAVVEQCLLNLVVNASDAMEGRGHLVIRVRRGNQAEGEMVVEPDVLGGLLTLSVRDSGPGISPEVVKKVFDPFYTTKERGNVRGTGLGLAMVYRIAKRYGLGVAVEPGGDGRGATFSLLIPEDAQQSPSGEGGQSGVNFTNDGRKNSDKKK